MSRMPRKYVQVLALWAVVLVALYVVQEYFAP